jgi:hypothetical protein
MSEKPIVAQANLKPFGESDRQITYTTVPTDSLTVPKDLTNILERLQACAAAVFDVRCVIPLLSVTDQDKASLVKYVQHLEHLIVSLQTTMSTVTRSVDDELYVRRENRLSKDKRRLLYLYLSGWAIPEQHLPVDVERLAKEAWGSIWPVELQALQAEIKKEREERRDRNPFEKLISMLQNPFQHISEESGDDSSSEQASPLDGGN